MTYLQGGSLSLGWKSGFYPLYVNELNKDALETYLINRDKYFPHLREKYNSRDIKEIKKNKKFFNNLFKNFKNDFKRDFKKNNIDLLVGGPPCQGFSGIGIRRSYSVDKVQLPSNHLFQDMAYFIHKIKPKVFLFENVEGLLRSKWKSDGVKGEIFEDILNTFKRIPSYSIRYKLVYAKDYGVPQNRPRVFIIGVNTKLVKKLSNDEDAVLAGYFPFPTSDYPNVKDIFSDLIDNNFEYGGSTEFYKSEPKTKWQENIQKISRE